MQIQVEDLRLADVVRLGGSDGEREVSKIDKNGAIRVWYRGDDPRLEPTTVYPRGARIEIQRPGSLFASESPPKTVAEARERIFRRLEALGWTVTRRRFGRANDYVTDPTDTVRLKLEAQAVALQVRWFDRGAWRWHPNPRSQGQIKAYATNLDDNVRALLETARVRSEKRFAADRARIEKQTAAATGAAATTSPTETAEPVVVKYAYEHGVLLGGATKPNKDAIKSLTVPYKFRYSRNLPEGFAWYVQRTRDTEQPQARIEQVADALRGRGVPVVVEYTPHTESSTPAASSTRPAKPEAAAKPARGRPPDNDKRARKLRELADKMEKAAEENLSVERLENTPRRARMAAGQRQDARRQIVLAQTIRRAADAVENGEFEYVARISTGAEVEELELALHLAAGARDRKLGRQSEDARAPEVEDAEFARFPSPLVVPSTLREVVETSKGLPGLSDARRRLTELAKPPAETITLGPEDVEAVRDLVRASRKAKRQIPHSIGQLVDAIKRVDRLGRLGVRDTATLRAALREYMSCCRGRVTAPREDPIAAKKRELQFAKIPGYFPTPRPLAERLVEAAQIQPGMVVLEPSAGSGAIAEVIRERHPHVRLHLVERNHTLREILEAEDFELVGYDFLGMDTRPVYDRIIMNPPFENRQDAEHIAHALRMLEPGGRLVAIASGSFGSREDAATAGLRRTIEALGGRIEPLPAGSFKASGTDVSAVMIVVDQPQANAVSPAVAAVVEKREAEKRVERARSTGIAGKWKAHLAAADEPGSSGWKNIPKTSCFEKAEGEASVTLCPSIQSKPVGACPPEDQTSSLKQLMLCQVGEDLEYFPKGESGIQAAKAEADNRLVRGRQRQATAPSEAGPMPSATDFDAQERFLDALVPSRIVYEARAPLRSIPVRLAPPAFESPDGTSGVVGIWHEPIPADARIEPRVSAGEVVSLREFVELLRSGKLVAYRGSVSESTLDAVIPAYEQAGLARAGATLHDVEFGRFGGRTIYWLRAPDGSKTYGPIEANGRQVTSQAVLAKWREAVQGGVSQPLTELPSGWTLDDTVLVALVQQGRRVWIAWQPGTELYTLKAEGEDWKERQSLPRQSTWRPGQNAGFADFPHAITWTLIRELARVSKGVRFRVAGPWLGVLFPSDFGKAVEFDPPTGGEADVDELELAYATYHELVTKHPDDFVLERWAKLGPKRIAWARKWNKKQAAARRKKEREMSRKKKSGKKKAAKKKAAGEQTRKKVAKKKRATKKAAKKKKAAKSQPPGKKKAAKKKKAPKKAARKKKSPLKKKAATQKAKTPAPTAEPAAAKPTAPRTSAEPENASEPSGRGKLHFDRHDVVRFRKRSQVAKGLGVSSSQEYTVAAVGTHEGRPVVLLRFGEDSSALMKVPFGHLAVVRRAEQVPPEIHACVAKLAKYDGQISGKTRKLITKLARRM